LPGKEVKRETLIDSGAWCDMGALERSSCQGPAKRGNRRGSSTKDKARRILIDRQVGASGDLPPQVRNSFLEQWYLPLTRMHHSKWEIIVEQLLAMGLIVKQDVVSDDDG
jgi:hypothetical protein